MPLAPSELILNDDGSIYHLNLKPGDVAETIITVGDPERVQQVSRHFDRIELKKQKREFACHTGRIGEKKLSVISTGIGTDNIDIVLNELDALFNVDFSSREIKDTLVVLDFIRLGTSGSIQSDISLGQFLVSEVAVGIDNMNNFYKIPEALKDRELEQKLALFLSESLNPYTIKGSRDLVKRFTAQPEFIVGKTLTSIGFYGPQGRSIRNSLVHSDFIESATKAGLTNLEMETSGIYLLAGNLGHRAISINAILANRRTGEFAEDPAGVVDAMIHGALEVIVK